MTHMEEARTTALRLYQVNYQHSGLPLLVVAATLDDAMVVAMASDPNGLDQRPALTVDVTDEFLALSTRAHDHMRTLFCAGRSGIVDYDDEEGWVFREA